MDGRGRAYDNIFVERLWRSVKHEDVYLNGYASMGELLLGLTKYFDFYNQERPHQGLGNQTPAAVYDSGVGGGALIIDKYGTAQSGADKYRSVLAQAQSPAVDKAPDPNRSRSVGSAPAGCELSPPLQADALALAKQPFKMETKYKEKTGAAPSSCVKSGVT